MSEVNRLVYSIIQFLCDQLQTGNLSSDASESLEVAIQCLEQAYGFNHADVTTANLHVTKSLLEIFRQATSNGEREVMPSYRPTYIKAATTTTTSTTRTKFFDKPSISLRIDTKTNSGIASRTRHRVDSEDSGGGGGSGKPLDLSLDAAKHQLERMLPKGGCVQCGREGRLTKRGRPHESYFGCRLCRVHLCRKRNCFQTWHTVH